MRQRLTMPVLLAALAIFATVLLLMRTGTAPSDGAAPDPPSAVIADEAVQVSPPDAAPLPSLALAPGPATPPPQLPTAAPAPAQSLAPAAEMSSAPVEPTQLIVGAVTSDGQALADVLAARWPKLPKLEVSVSTDVSGPAVSERWLALRPLLSDAAHEPKVWTEPVQLPGYLCFMTIDDPLPVVAVLHIGTTPVAQQLVAPGARKVWFTLTLADVEALTGTVKGRVVAASNKAPLPQATVSLTRQSLAPELRPNRYLSAKGERFELQDVAAGTAFLLVEAGGYEKRSLKIQVPHGRGLDLGDIELDQGLACAGRVVNREGAPTAAFMWIRPLDAGSDVLDAPMVLAAPSDDDGKFWLGPIGRSQYLLTVQSLLDADLPATAYAIVDTRNGSSPELTVTLTPTTRVSLDGVHSELSWTDLSIADASGHALMSFGREYLRLSGFAAEKPFPIDLPPGRYSLQLAEGSRITWTHAFEVTSESLTIKLP